MDCSAGLQKALKVHRCESSLRETMLLLYTHSREQMSVVALGWEVRYWQDHQVNISSILHFALGFKPTL